MEIRNKETIEKSRPWPNWTLPSITDWLGLVLAHSSEQLFKRDWSAMALAKLNFTFNHWLTWPCSGSLIRTTFQKRLVSHGLGQTELYLQSLTDLALFWLTHQNNFSKEIGQIREFEVQLKDSTFIRYPYIWVNFWEIKILNQTGHRDSEPSHKQKK